MTTGAVTHAQNLRVLRDLLGMTGTKFGCGMALCGACNYRVLRMNEAPRVDVHLVRNGESPGGIGEPGTAVTAAALSNAIYAATGKRLRRLPLQPGLVLGAR